MILSQLHQLDVFRQKSIENKLVNQENIEQASLAKRKYLESLRDYIRIRFLLLEDKRLHKSADYDDDYFSQISTKLLRNYKYQKAKVNKLFNGKDVNKVMF